MPGPVPRLHESLMCAPAPSGGSGSVTFPSSVCVCLSTRQHLWDEGRTGWEKQPLGNPGSNPAATHRAARGQGLAIRLPAAVHPGPARADPSLSSHLPEKPPSTRHPLPEETGLFCAGCRPLVRVGTPAAACGVGEGGRNSRGMLGMLMP